MNDQSNTPTVAGAHVQWLADWHEARDTTCDAPDDSAEENQLLDAAQALSILLATTPAKSPADMIAQIE